MPEQLEMRSIDFPRAIGAQEAGKILELISVSHPCEIRYTEKSLVRLEGLSSSENERYVQEISGLMTRSGLAPMLLEFQFFRGFRKSWTPEFHGMRFLTPPGQDLDEIPNEEVAFMNETKGYVNDYFSNQK